MTEWESLAKGPSTVLMQRRLKWFSTPASKRLLAVLTDECIRPRSHRKAIHHLQKNIERLGIPSFLSCWERLGFGLVCYAGHLWPWIVRKLIFKLIQKDLKHVLFFQPELKAHLHLRKKNKIILNIHNLGEAVLSDADATDYLARIIVLLKRHDIDMFSLKLSALLPPFPAVAWEEVKPILLQRLDHIRAAVLTHKRQGSPFPILMMDMEAFSTLEMTVDICLSLMSDPAWHSLVFGVALQAYCTETPLYLDSILDAARARVTAGGSPFRIRLVKGANLGMERIESELNHWPYPFFETKAQTDLQFRALLERLITPELAPYIQVGVASHNLRDIAFAHQLSTTKAVPIVFELLEGMAPEFVRVLHQAGLPLALYCPVVEPTSFTAAVAYLVRRFDEQSNPEHYLNQWVHGTLPPLTQPPVSPTVVASQNKATPAFTSHPDTRWFLASERLRLSQATPIEVSVPVTSTSAEAHIIKAKAAHPTWESVPYDQKCQILKRTAEVIQTARFSLIKLICEEVSKPIGQADAEISETADFLTYYASLPEIKGGHSRGIMGVASPWNFPMSIPCSGVASALLTGHCVILKPAPEAPRSAMALAQCFWQAGIPKDVLQVLICDDTVANTWAGHLDGLVFTGSTQTARLIQSQHPHLPLFAETGGKNTLIVTAFADLDLAIRDIVHSAFGFSGQKCSAASLLICEKDVYDNPQFATRLRQATESLMVGPVNDPRSVITPLITQPNPDVRRELTSIENQQTWLLQPSCKDQDRLWSPGIKWGVQDTDRLYRLECFAPLLGVMRADSLEHAIALANGTPYGLTAGLMSLDEDEQLEWMHRIEAGNMYLNRGITGAIVGRQPFGGCKDSRVGMGLKTGGPNSLLPLLKLSTDTPDLEAPEQVYPDTFKELLDLSRQFLNEDTYPQFLRSTHSYLYWASQMRKVQKLTHLKGEHHLYYWVPEPQFISLSSQSTALEIWRVLAAALSAPTPVTLNCPTPLPSWDVAMRRMKTTFIRFTALPEAEFEAQARKNARSVRYLDLHEVHAHGRWEMPKYLREVSVTITAHRYGQI